MAEVRRGHRPQCAHHALPPGRHRRGLGFGRNRARSPHFQLDPRFGRAQPGLSGRPAHGVSLATTPPGHPRGAQCGGLGGEGASIRGADGGRGRSGAKRRRAGGDSGPDAASGEAARLGRLAGPLAAAVSPGPSPVAQKSGVQPARGRGFARGGSPPDPRLQRGARSPPSPCPGLRCGR